jgi:hypothetical protein
MKRSGTASGGIVVNNAVDKKVKRSFGSAVVGASQSLRDTKSKAKKK